MSMSDVLGIVIGGICDWIFGKCLAYLLGIK